ncbi:MAG: hypothetical protein LBI55_02555 [Oscillospiraceae bacterium]|nr:hypothetical protein [Oscillospiraceae bacterium]
MNGIQEVTGSNPVISTKQENKQRILYQVKDFQILHKARIMQLMSVNQFSELYKSSLNCFGGSDQMQ